MKTQHLLFLGAGLAVAALRAPAAEPTAFELARLGNQYVGVQSKDKVVQIRSEKSIGGLTPGVWYVVYYDPDATFKAVEVKFGAGQKLDVSHPLRALEIATDEHLTLDKNKLKVDSDRALAIAKAMPLLKNLKLKASQLKLGHGDAGPQWRVELWAAKLNHPNEDANIGVVVLSAADGSLTKADLHPNSVE
jgi:hypothetical protein